MLCIYTLESHPPWCVLKLIAYLTPPLTCVFHGNSLKWVCFADLNIHKSMVSCQKGPTRHADAWQIGPFWQDTLEICHRRDLWEKQISLLYFPIPLNMFDICFHSTSCVVPHSSQVFDYCTWAVSRFIKPIILKLTIQLSIEWTTLLVSCTIWEVLGTIRVN